MNNLALTSIFSKYSNAIIRSISSQVHKITYFNSTTIKIFCRAIQESGIDAFVYNKSSSSCKDLQDTQGKEALDFNISILSCKDLQDTQAKEALDFNIISTFTIYLHLLAHSAMVPLAPPVLRPNRETTLHISQNMTFCLLRPKQDFLILTRVSLSHYHPHRKVSLAFHPIGSHSTCTNTNWFHYRKPVKVSRLETDDLTIGTDEFNIQQIYPWNLIQIF
jgi:hypothetical protein